ncbi:GspH/FimT family pseudopilin [Marinobacter sp. 1-3A]|uniref:GspH/FimT family pseudopilin n=1 Tax=Marinobacter sp. 1-3A TaxID=2582920 RepID=UPI00190879B2|nr:GspH/FimT family pseudopilin [Marinobacter sp. 1-3A]MBK1874664.1 GspH/FimT family pseudopilin [Marinobacter sp. 1-3A]
MPVFPKQMGLSLLELAISLTLISILVTSALPDFQGSLAKNKTQRKTRDLLSLLHLARSTAVNEGSLATVCPLNEQNQCVKNWNDHPITLFLDPKNQRMLTGDTRLIRVLPTTRNVILSVAPLQKSYFQFDGLGASHGSMGNLSICNTGNALYSSKQIVINLSGRVRTSVDLNGDGIAERSNGAPVEC